MIDKIKSYARSGLAMFKAKPEHLRPSIKMQKHWYGNDYGGFYACPNKIGKSSIVYSFGIGEDISFDRDIISNHGCSVYGFDPTPKSINWIQNNSNSIPSNFTFLNYGISDIDGDFEFFLPKNINHVSGSLITQSNVDEEQMIIVKMKSLATIMRDLNHSKVDLIKMDIEGAEYKVLNNLLESCQYIGQILIEFHDRFFDDGIEKTKIAIELLRESGFEIFAVSDSLEEVSFINKKTNF
jgi:FkbM family methyltransferase